jgi:O-antigen ligase
MRLLFSRFFINYKALLLLILALTIPLSIQITVFGSSKLNAPSEIICLIFCIYLVFKFLKGIALDINFLKHPITVLLAIDLFWMLITTIFSDKPDVSIKRLLVKATYLVVYFYFFYELFKYKKQFIVKTMVCYALGLFVVILITFRFHYQFNFSISGSSQACAPFYNDHTAYGTALTFIIPIIAYLIYVYKQTLKLKLVLITFLIFFLLALYFSFSRAAWLSLGFGVLAVNFISTKYKLLYYVGFVLALSIAVYKVDALKTAFSTSKNISHGKDVTMHIKSVTNVKSDASNKERLNRWKCAMRMFADKPWLGFGPGTYQFFYGNYQQRVDLTYISTFKGTKGHAHSEYLNYLSEEGFLGLLIFIITILSINYTSVKLIKRITEKKDKFLVITLFISILTFLFHSFFNGFIESDKIAMLYYTALAALVALDIKQKEQNWYEAQTKNPS